MEFRNSGIVFVLATLALAVWVTFSLFKISQQTHSDPDLQAPDKHPGWYGQYMAMKANDEGEIPTGLLTSWYYQEQLQAKRQDSTKLRKVKELGPFSVGGRTRAILVDRQDSDHIFAGSVSGGLWESFNGGENWTPKNDFADNLSITSLTQSPMNPDIIYYGTGEPLGNSADVPGEGIYRSTDGGNSFSPLPNTLNDSFTAVWEVQVAKNQEGVFYAATQENGLFRFSDQGDQLEKVFDANGAVSDIEVLPDSSVFVAVISRGIFKSENGFGNFQKVNQNFPSENFSRLELAFCREQPRFMYVAFSSNPRQTGSQVGLTGLWRSTDTGNTWQEVTNPADDNDVSFALSNYALMLDVKPDNPNTLVTGSVDATFSTDGGQTWNTLPESHVDYHHLTTPPNQSDEFFVGNDGGVYRYSWSTFGLTDLNEGYQVTQFYGGHYFPDSNEVIGGTQDNGTQGFNRGLREDVFIKYFGGDGAFCAVNQQFPDTGYVSTQRGRIQKSTNMTDPNPSFTNAYQDMDQNFDGEIDDNVWFINPFEINPAAPNQLFFTTKEKVWLTTDGAENWQPLTDRLFFGVPYNTAITKDEEPVIFVHGDGGLFYRMTDPLTSNQGDETNLGNSVPRRVAQDFMRTLKIHPEDSSIVYAGFSNFEEESRIWRVTESLSDEPDWEPIHGDLPNTLPVNSVAIHPEKPDSFLIAGTDFGLYVTQDQGNHWTKEETIPNVSIHQVRVRPNDNRLFIYTHGRGIWKADLPDLSRDTDQNDQSDTLDPQDTTLNFETFRIYPNPTRGEINLEIPFETDKRKAQAILYTISGKLVKRYQIRNQAKAIVQVPELRSGYYLLQVKTPNNTFQEKVMRH